MRSTSCRREKTLVVFLSGPLTSGAAWLDQLSTTRPAPQRVIVNLAAVTTVDRNGADALLDAYIATTLRLGTFALTGPTTLVGRQLDDLGISRVVVTLRRAATVRTVSGGAL
jgi:anti-anti-sigma regulatory factor